MTAAGFVGSVAAFLVTLSRGLLHEATVLLSRRHSLRFGRLYVYLLSNNLTREDLAAVFNWNAEFTTAFGSIQGDKTSKTLVESLLQEIKELNGKLLVKDSSNKGGREPLKP